ncbi:MAG TPA: hypothetical protein VGC79_34250, partial [Polyangiaceae bacterium]
FRGALADAASATCEAEVLPGACSRLEARANGCGVSLAGCTVDSEFSATEAVCIASCAERVTCADIQQAESGTITFELDNPFTKCAYKCQCTELRNCYIVGD